jgi:lambda family phage portal protein
VSGGQVVTVSVGERRTWSERLDGLIGMISPKWAAERAAWRSARRELLSYRGAERSRTDRPRGRSRGSADYQLEAGRERSEMVFRARELEENNGLAEGLLARSVENLVGTGIRPQARSKNKAWNKKVEALFATYAENCDVRGLDSLWDLQALTVRSYLRDGDVATHMMSDGRLQSIESDQIASPMGKSGDARFADGVELDVAGRPLKFHIVDERDRVSGPGVHDRASLPKRIEIDAKDVLYLSRRTRLQQTRGLTVFAQSFWLFEQLDGNIEATTIAARIAACFGALIKRAHPYNGGTPITGANGKSYKDWSMEPGMMKELEPGDDIVQISPQQPTQNFAEFVTLLARLLGIPLGLQIELVLLDSSKANFSSMRGALMQAFKTWRRMLSAIIFQWCRPLWRRRVRMWIDAGELEDIEDWDKHAWVPPGWTWVDPKSEVESNMLAVDAGFRTVHDIVAEQGGDFDEWLETRKQEIADMEAAGIPIVRSVSSRDPLPDPADAPPPAPKPPKKTQQRFRLEVPRCRN